MKICFYALRDFDELPMVEKYSKEFGIDFVWTPEYPNENNIALADGCDGISFTPCLVTEAWLEKWRAMGVTSICNRSIGYDHVPLKKAKELGIHVNNSTYPTDCVADFAIMLILMCIRNMNQTMIRAAAQDYTLKHKMGRDLSHMTVGVIGTGNIGRVLMKHIKGFGCKITVSSSAIFCHCGKRFIFIFGDNSITAGNTVANKFNLNLFLFCWNYLGIIICIDRFDSDI